MATENYTIETYDEEGNLIDTETLVVEIPAAIIQRQEAIQTYRAATETLLASNVSTTVKQWVRAQVRLMRLIARELNDLQV